MFILQGSLARDTAQAPVSKARPVVARGAQRSLNKMNALDQLARPLGLPIDAVDQVDPPRSVVIRTCRIGQMLYWNRPPSIQKNSAAQRRARRASLTASSSSLLLGFATAIKPSDGTASLSGHWIK